MIGYDFKYNGQNFSESIFDKVLGNGIKFTDVIWHDLATSDDQNNRQGTHGIETSATFIRGRVINISGQIISQSRAKRNEYMQILQQTFAPPNLPNAFNRGFNDFEFTDDDGLDWIIRAKTLNMPSYDPSFGLNEFVITPFNLQLIAEDPAIYSAILNQFNASEGFYGGLTFEANFPAQFNEYGFAATLTNTGNWNAPLKVTITANQDTGQNIRLVNAANDQYIGIQSQLLQGEILEIDTSDTSILKDGLNVSADRIAGSIFQYLLPGNNAFIVRDDAQILGDGLAVDVLFEWNNVKI